MNAIELKEERLLRKLTQEEMADLLGSPVSTYRKWEYDLRKVPAWVVTKLSPASMTLPGLEMADIFALDRIARERGITIEQLVRDFIKSGIQALLCITLLVCFSHHVFHPNDQVARRFGRRRDDAAYLECADGDA